MPPTLREQTRLTAVRVLDELSRSGALPAELIRFIQTEHCRNTGRVLTSEQVRRHVARYVDEWAGLLLAEDDERAASNKKKKPKKPRYRKVVRHGEVAA